MKNLRAVLLLVAILLGLTPFLLTPAPQADAQSGGAVVVVNTFRLNLRTGPGVQYQTIGELVGGETYAVEAISPDRIWFKISGTPAGTGWVRGRFTIFRGDIDSVPVDAGPYGALVPNVFIVNINIPAFDRPGGRIIGTIQGGGQQYSVVGRSFDGIWIQLQTSLGIVWAQSASGAFRGQWFDLDITFGQEAAVTFQAEQEVVVVNAFRLNVRTGPGVEFLSLGTVEGGDQFRVIGISPDRIWFRVTGTPFGDGWVRGRFIIFRGDIEAVNVVEGPYGQLQPETFVMDVFIPVFDNIEGQQLGLLTPSEYIVTGRSFEGGWIRIQTADFGNVWTQLSRGFFRGDFFDVPIITDETIIN
jgi:uncharacterized protein YraI